MRFGLLLVTGVTACNWAFAIETTGLAPPDDAGLGPDADPRIDLDRDGIKDIDDPCIAPDTDLLVDSDGDGMINRDDPCPFDMPATADSDGDGVGDACDPAQGTRDLRRCVMAFSDPDFDVRMWIPRDPTETWFLYYPRMLYVITPGSIVAGWSFEAPSGSTTYDITGRLLGPAPSLSVLARAQRDPGGAQVDCTLASSATGWELRATGVAAVPTGVAVSTNATYTMQVTVTPDAADGVTLRCRAAVGAGAPVSVESTAALPFGTLGLMGGGVQVYGITIYGNDDA